MVGIATCGEIVIANHHRARLVLGIYINADGVGLILADKGCVNSHCRRQGGHGRRSERGRLSITHNLVTINRKPCTER